MAFAHPQFLAASFPWENLVFLAFIVIAMIFRLIGKVFEGAKKNSQRPSAAEPIPRAEPEGNETERIRRFLEALGQPTSAPPPRRVTPKVAPSAPRPRPGTVQPIDPFPRPKNVFLPIPREEFAPPVVVATPPPLPPVSAPPAIAPQVPVAATEIRPTAPTGRRPLAATPPLPQKLDVVSLLHSSREGLRQAVVLREILGPPRGLQPLTNELAD